MIDTFFIANWFHRKYKFPYKLAVEHNTGSGLPVILLHGIAADSSTWDPLYPLIGPAYHLIAIDLLGHGHSPQPEWSSYSVEEHVRSIHRTINSLHLHEPAVLIGHSMGSIIAMHYARMYPDEVKKLFMLSPPIVVNLEGGKKTRLKLTKTSYAQAYKYIREHKNFTLHGVNRIRQILNYESFTVTEGYWTSFVRSLQECIEDQTNIGLELLRVKCPIEIFYGSHDRIISQSNVRSLSIIKGLTIHELPVWHRFSPKYAAEIARELSYSRV
jgi:pimeloyl-ACP methyl ester carboxylesterase